MLGHLAVTDDPETVAAGKKPLKRPTSFPRRPSAPPQLLVSGTTRSPVSEIRQPRTPPARPTPQRSQPSTPAEGTFIFIFAG
jgi:hypothetical protein